MHSGSPGLLILSYLPFKILEKVLAGVGISLHHVEVQFL